MSPETGLSPGVTILGEAERIKREAAMLQQTVEEATGAVRASVQNRVRRNLGYERAEAINASDLTNTNIADETPVVAPDTLTMVLPISSESAATTRTSRESVADILGGRSDRLIAIVGPCSVHDPEAALEYAEHVAEWRDKYGKSLEIIMRTYVEKPRTIRGWKGLVSDPKLNGSDDLNLGLIAIRMLTCQITNKGVPIAMERLNPLTPQYLNGLVAYDAIGARNVTDQTAREYASGSSAPVGFKNSPEGSILAAAQAVASANGPHALLGIGMNGMPQREATRGNPLAHIILRGSDKGSNYEKQHIRKAKEILAAKDLLEAIVVDASHGNSGKQADRQIEVVRNVCMQITLGEAAIKGVMIESNLVAGRQDLVAGRKLEYGKSVTDECVGLEAAEAMMELLATAGAARRRQSRL
jgi:3-deoxy-7-phosphoheptulonate synthase